MLQEFKDFINRGNVMELAVGLIMGAAFGAVVKSFVNEIVMPVVGVLLGGTDFSNYYIQLTGEGNFASLEAAREAGAAVVAYGQFLNVLITFIITAFVIFLIVRSYNRMKKKEEEAPKTPPAPAREEVLLEEIRDLLAKK